MYTSKTARAQNQMCTKLGQTSYNFRAEARLKAAKIQWIESHSVTVATSLAPAPALVLLQLQVQSLALDLFAVT